MKSRWPFSHSDHTRFIVIDTSVCEACWACVEACPRKVLGTVKFLWHRHVRIDNPDACSGCRLCVKACVHGAITRGLASAEKRAS
jgi:NAD-dependent dihydropyrimidine dehydrogenase PreA subunit